MVIVAKLDELLWLNKLGDVFANEEEALGMKMKDILKSQAKSGWTEWGEKVSCIGTATARPQQE